MVDGSNACGEHSPREPQVPVQYNSNAFDDRRPAIPRVENTSDLIAFDHCNQLIVVSDVVKCDPNMAWHRCGQCLKNGVNRIDVRLKAVNQKETRIVKRNRKYRSGRHMIDSVNRCREFLLQEHFLVALPGPG